MLETAPTDTRRLVAEHNLEAILDAAERLLEAGEQPSISGVANAAGVSRPTVYAHFRDRRALLEAVVERTVRRAMAAVEAAQVDRGTAPEALQRLIAASWRELASHDVIAHAAAAELSAEAMRAAHETARASIAELLERGRREGSFRTDLPTSWLVTAALALTHATAEEVRTGQLDPDTALGVLSHTLATMFAGP